MRPYDRETRDHLAVPCRALWKRSRIYIEPSTEQATKRHKAETRSEQNNLEIYTDGNRIGNEIGAAAVSPTIMDVKKAYMGDSNTSTVFTAKLQGIRLALTMTLEDWDKGKRRQKAVVYTDNQAAIRTANNQSINQPLDILSGPEGPEERWSI
jgi:hypothetical protein